MVRPASFQYNEQTAISNDYQKKPQNLTKKAVIARAQREFDEMVEILRDNGIDVLVVEDTKKPEKPDAVFPNNWISMHETGDIYLYPMKTPNRSAERRSEIIDQLKKRFIIHNVHDLSRYEKENRALEGTGSIIFDHIHKKAYACLSPRTDKEIFETHCINIGYKPICFHAYKRNGAAQYHTNVVMCIGEGFCVICLDSITDTSEQNRVKNELCESGLDIIEISRAQLEEHFAGNMLQVRGDTKLLVMSEHALKSLEDEQIERIEKHTNIIAVPIYLIEEIGGGSARCMMAEIFMEAREL